MKDNRETLKGAITFKILIETQEVLSLNQPGSAMISKSGYLEGLKCLPKAWLMALVTFLNSSSDPFSPG